MWAAVLLNCAIDRFSIVTERYGTELHILSDGDIGISLAGFTGFVAFLAGASLPLTSSATTISPGILGNVITLAQAMRTVQTVGLLMFSVMGVLWYITLHRFQRYAHKSTKLTSAAPSPDHVEGV